MYNSFETSKDSLKEQYKEPKWCCGDGEEALRERVDAVLESVRKDGVERQKAEILACIFRHAQLFLHEDDIFADQIRVGRILRVFQSANYSAVMKGPCHESLASIQSLQQHAVVEAGMDFGHIAPDWEYVQKRGIAGIREDLAHYRTLNADDPEKCKYYDNRIMVYDAMLDCMRRFAELAQSRHTAKGDFVAENLRALCAGEPQTLAQAMQLTLFYYFCQTKIDDVIVRSLGGLDRLYEPLWRRDLESGRYTEAQLRTIIRYFLWKISAMGVTANLPFYICGMKPDGSDASSDFTLALLEEYEALDIYDPKIHVMYHPGMDARVLEKLLSMIRSGKNSFVFMNTPLISRSLEKLGIGPEDAKRVIVYGCYEAAAEGTEVPCTCGGKINLAKAVELALFDGADARTGEQLSLHTGLTFADFDAFYEAVMTHLIRYTTLCMDALAEYDRHFTDVCPSLIMSPAFPPSLMRGKDVYAGGAKYGNTSVVGAGLATLVDSLLAVKRIVFEEKSHTLDELREILLSNWEKAPLLRAKILKNRQKFGNADPEADALTADVAARFASLINNRPNGRGGVFRCGLFSVDWRYRMGKDMIATPDGRLDAEPVSKNTAAVIGQDRAGVTAYLNSLLKLDAETIPDGYVADVALHESAVRGEEGMQAFRGLLTTFMERGGFSVHFNILSPDALINAQREPEKYRNLQIRLCGWNVRFIDLERSVQDEFIRMSSNAM